MVYKLKDMEIRKAKPTDKVYKMSDGNGLYLVINPNGSKLWRKKFYINKKEQVLALGKYPDVSLAKARELCDKANLDIKQGIDPRDNIRRQKQQAILDTENSLAEIAKLWFEVWRSSVTKKTAQRAWSSFHNHVLVNIGNIQIKDIKPLIAVNCLKPLSNAGKYDMLNRVTQTFNMVMEHAVNIGLVEVNSLIRIRRVFPTHQSNNLPTIHPNTLSELMALIYSNKIRSMTRALMLWQLHTLARAAEAANAQWCEIDLTKRLWTIPAERMKKRREHVVPLSHQMVSLLQNIQSLGFNSQYIFPSDRKANAAIHSETVTKALKRNGFKDKLVAHGFRSIGSTYLHDQGYNSDWIEFALAHQDKNKVRAAYNRSTYLDQRRKMMQAWSDFIDASTHDNKHI